LRSGRWTPLRVKLPQPPLERCEADRVELADRSLEHALDAKALCMGNELREHHHSLLKVERKRPGPAGRLTTERDRRPARTTGTRAERKRGAGGAAWRRKGSDKWLTQEASVDCS
jgi:hypothetical protein